MLWWWWEYGINQFPDAENILLLCDAGGANSYRHFIFKHRLMDFARQTGLSVIVCHYPPYCSKRNPIDHQLFSHVHKAMEGVVFINYETIKTAIEQPSTKIGLTVTVRLNLEICQEKQLDFVSEFNKIKTSPEIINFTNEFDINNNSGHIQGIQNYKNETGKYLFMSGSSDSNSYCAVVKLGDENKIVSANKLMDKPFKHAVGFQVFENYLAVGIEDNTVKDKSKVCFYDISAPEKPFSEPIAVIERKGEPLRSTAGCVGITKYKNKILVAVGDWDTKHMDFYTAEFDEMPDKALSKISTIDTEQISRQEWINNEWHLYQNINLFNINGQLFLFGLGQNKQSENIADLFELTEVSVGNFVLKKVAAKTFSCTNDCSFKAAAGVEYDNGEFTILASGYNINTLSYLNVFKSY